MIYIIIIVLVLVIYILSNYQEQFKTIKCATIEAPPEFKRGSIGKWKKTCLGKRKCNELTIKCNNQIKSEGGVGEEVDGSFCFPSQLKDIFLVVLFPPLWVIIKESTNKVPLKNAMRIVVSLVLTSCFYFPGLIHAMNIMRHDGKI